VKSASAARERALAYVEEFGDTFAVWRARSLLAAQPPRELPLPDGVVQRSDGRFEAAAAGSGEAGLALTLRIVGALDDLRALHLPEVERACAHLAVRQADDGSWGPSDATEAERSVWTAMLAGLFAKTRCARASMLAAAGDYAALRFSPERVQDFAWDAIAAYTHCFANLPHEAADAVLQWTGRELERGFRVGRFDAVRTARVLLYADAPAIPGARLDAGEVIEQLLAEQAADGGWLRPEDPSPPARVAHSLDALTALVRFT
jgi:hypothetical protein